MRLRRTAFMLGLALLPGVLTPLPAQTRLDAGSSLGLFTTLADNFLHAQLGLSVTNIPVFTNQTFVYAPAVQRLLQLAANICDATTNREFTAGAGYPYCPSVFRPLFGTSGDSNNPVIYIRGYVEENTTPNLAMPLALPEQAGLVTADTVNIYGVPWVIGARKGFPSFNEFSMQTFSEISRKLQINKGSLGAPRSAWHTNQMFVIGISNVVGVEAWNSYYTNYTRQVSLLASNDLVMTLTITNDAGDLLYSITLNHPASAAYAVNNWPGFHNSGLPANDAPSFQIPINADLVFVPDSIYQANPPGLIQAGVSNVFEQTMDFRMPHFVLGITNRLRFMMVDTATGRIIDYASFNGITNVVDLTAQLPANDPPLNPLSFWDTNLVSSGGGNPASAPYGVLNQVFGSLSQNAIPLNIWNNAQLGSSTDQSKSAVIALFAAFINNDPANTNLLMQVPFTPTRKFSDYRTWQVNDPLVHYSLSDLSSYPQNNNQFTLIIPPRSVPTNGILANLSRVNDRYRPWGGNPNSPDPATDHNLALKDPLVRNSDAWDFPAALPLDVSWLGRVHRGTPWQTVYLKSSAIDSQTWQNWIGNGNAQDAVLSQPTNDWHLASLFAFLVNTNSPRDLLSVNNINPASWSATFSNGVPVLTNITTDFDLQNGVPPQFAPLLMDSNSPQTALILDAINSVRLNQPGGFFRDTGDILATPELSANSPWLNWNSSVQVQNGLTDAAYETIPSQILAFLRLDSVGALLQTDGQLQLQFTGYDGFPYEIQVSANLQDWAVLRTAYPTNGILIFNDPAGLALTQRFYRSNLAP